MTPSGPVIATDQLFLRPLTFTDVDDLLEYQSDEETVRFIPWLPRTRAQVEQALRDHAMNGTERPSADGEFALLAWQLRSTGKVIGQSNLGIESAMHRHASIGWVTNPAFRRQGHATQATSALIDWAFRDLQLHRLTATIDTRNVVSARFAESLGMRLEATHVDDEWFKGAWTSTLVYAILDREWLPRRVPGHPLER